MLRIVCSVSDRDNWTLRPYIYLMSKYWSEQQSIVIAGYTKPDFSLPPNVTFHSIDNYNYPANRWSDGVLKFFSEFTDEWFIWSYSDFWLRRTVNHAAVASLYDYAREHPNVYRIDLGTDRLFAHDNRYMNDYERYGSLNIIKSEMDWSYHHSSQMGIFNREKFMSLLKPGWSPWEFELVGAQGVKPDWLVLGTRQIVVDYVHAVPSGVSHPILDGIDAAHVQYMTEQGWIP